MNEVSGRDDLHGRQLRIGIIRRGDLDDVCADEVQAVQTADDGAQLARGPAACFGGAGCGSVSCCC